VPESFAADGMLSRPDSSSETGVVSGLMPPAIPTCHGITRIHLMSRDPHSVFAYWELTPEFREMTARHFGCNWDQLPVVLRLYTVDGLGNVSITREVEASRLTDNWMFGDLEPGRTYLVDLGTRNVYNVFVAILRSNSVNTPRNWPGRSIYGRLTGLGWYPEEISTSFHRLS
jgi:hypothetical protein